MPIKTPHIVLIGYYGQCNFGDDILLKVSHSLAQRILPDAQISVRVGTSADYIESLLATSIGVMSFGKRDHVDLIIHGGGGTFFDFLLHGIVRRFKNNALLLFGVNIYVKLEALARRIVRRPRLSAGHRIGIGIGVGSYTAGSPKLREALPILADLDILWVRDSASEENIKKIGVKPPVILGSDLAFLSQYWCPPDLQLTTRRELPTRPAIGVAIRDWPVGSGAAFADRFRPTLIHLSKLFNLTLIFLDANTDVGSIAALTDFQQQVWNPNRQSLGDFTKALSAQDALITSRAHGAICGACVGRPSILIEIEDKIRTVNGMLPKSTRLATCDIAPVALARMVEDVLAISHSEIVSDVLRNRNLSEQAFLTVKEHLKLRI